jgi:HEAT repeat protein
MDEIGNLQLRIQELISKLENEDRNVQKKAAKLLETIGMPAVPALIKAANSYRYLEGGRCHSVAILNNIAVENPGNAILTRFISTFIHALGDADKRVRREAVEALRKIGNPAIPTLIEVLKNKKSDEYVRAGCVNALQIMTVENPDYEFVTYVISIFIEALNDRHFEVRMNAAEALGKNGDLSAVPALIGEFKYKEWHLQARFLAPLRMISDKCKSIKSLEEYESKLQEGYDLFEKKYKKEDLFEVQMQIAQLRMEAAKKKNKLSKDNGILLDSKPKPPIGSKMYQQLRRLRNG